MMRDGKVSIEFDELRTGKTLKVTDNQGENEVRRIFGR